jgi:hypothetical protein
MHLLRALEHSRVGSIAPRISMSAPIAIEALVTLLSKPF